MPKLHIGLSKSPCSDLHRVPHSLWLSIANADHLPFFGDLDLCIGRCIIVRHHWVDDTGNFNRLAPIVSVEENKRGLVDNVNRMCLYTTAYWS